MNRHIDFTKLNERYPYMLKYNDNTKGKLYIGLDTDKIGLSLDFNTIKYVIEKVYSYLMFICYDGRCYDIKIADKGHLIIIESHY